MKKISILLMILIMLSISGCKTQKKPPVQTPVLQSGKTKIMGNYLGSDVQGNYFWGGAMNLAWNDLTENILHEKLQLKTDDKLALDITKKFNYPVFTKNDLDESSYYIKSGYGQETVNAINKESRIRFPNKSFKDLNVTLNPSDIIAYAYFLKEVEYKNMFEKADVNFEGSKVAGFTRSQGENVKIIDYQDDDKFIVSLQLKDENDQLILAKGYDMNNPQILLDEINKDHEEYSLGDNDRFEAPELHLNLNRNYDELVGKSLANKKFTDYRIEKMFENIKFDMDEKGAKVENEGVMIEVATSGVSREIPKNFILDKPYWVVMKRKTSQNPYFLLGVNNTALMEKKQ